MKKVFRLNRTGTAILLLLTISLLLTGCRYNSVEEYLEALGILDPYDYEEEDPDVGISINSDLYSSDVPGENSSFGLVEKDVSLAEEEEEDEGELFTPIPENADAADYLYAGSYTNPEANETDEDMMAAREEIGLTPSNIAKVKENQKGLYAFERLTDAGKTLYAELLTIMENQGEKILVSTTSDEAIELVFDYVMADHPEIFYVDGYQYTNYTFDNIITKISFSGNYTYDKNEVKSRQARINDYVNECLTDAPSSEDDYYVIKYVYEYLINNTEYDINAADNQNICSVFINKKSVCNGYAKATQYLLNRLGITCTLVTGTVDTRTSKGVRHAWDLVMCNDTYYYLDTTWGDSSYQTASGESADSSRLPAVNYDYLNVTTEEILKNHKIADSIKMPECNSMTDNFYVREEEYFTSAQMSLVGDLFDRRYKEGSDNVTIKCASKEVYDELFEKLVTERGVFEYLSSENSKVSYTTYADTGTIIFWI